MKQLNLLMASLAVTCFALYPAASLADEELDVTIEVFDDLSEVDGDFTEMRGPENDRELADLDARSNREDEQEVRDSLRDEMRTEEDRDDVVDDELVAVESDGDGFEHDEGSHDEVRELVAEDDFEENEDVHSDEFVEEEEHGDDEMSEEGEGDGDAGFEDEIESVQEDDLESDLENDSAAEDDMLADEGAEAGEGEGTGDGDI